VLVLVWVVSVEFGDGLFKRHPSSGIGALFGFHRGDDHGVVIFEALHVVILGGLDTLGQEVV